MRHADIALDFTAMMAEVVGASGLSRKEIESVASTFRPIHSGLTDLKKLGQLPFADLPYHEESAHQCEQAAQRVRATFDHLLWIGIGGSSLGTVCLQQALAPRSDLRFTVCDHLDADSWRSLSETLRKTLVVVVSKSGKTTETLAAFLFFRDRLKKELGDGYRSHLRIITDPHEGPLRQIAESDKIEGFSIPPGVGGRYSVLTAVGLFPAACLGIDVGELLAGARRMDERCQSADLWSNPAAMSAVLHTLADKKRGRSIRVLMPYGERLRGFSGWFAQLGAESLGKRYSLKGTPVHTGPTPLRASGPADQHSLLQLLLEGPEDKVVTFVDAGNSGEDLSLPPSEIPEFALLGGKKIDQILQMEREATELALAKNGRPSLTILLKELNPFTLGQLLYLSEMETVYSGQLYNVNPFDQPGVELIKKYLRGLLGDPEYRPYLREIAELEELRKKKAYRI